MPASITNFNNTTPAAPAGSVNVEWQKTSNQVGTDPASGLPIYDSSANVPIATTSQLGLVKPDGSTINISSGGVISAAGGGGGGSGLFAGILSALPTQAGTGLTTAYNQTGTFAATNVGTGILFQETTAESAIMEGLLKAYPGTAFTLTILTTMPAPAANYAGNGIVVAASTTGNAMWFGTFYDSEYYFLAYEWATPSSLGSSLYFATSGVFQGSPYVWLRYKDDGTNLYFSYSYDGIVFIQLYTVSKASSYLGSGGFNYLGYIIEPQSVAMASVLMSWAITEP
jgi:hypothetical protein